MCLAVQAVLTPCSGGTASGVVDFSDGVSHAEPTTYEAIRHLAPWPSWPSAAALSRLSDGEEDMQAAECDFRSPC